jgi:hypothetical protein
MAEDVSAQFLFLLSLLLCYIVISVYLSSVPFAFVVLAFHFLAYLFRHIILFFIHGFWNGRFDLLGIKQGLVVLVLAFIHGLIAASSDYSVFHQRLPECNDRGLNASIAQIGQF